MLPMVAMLAMLDTKQPVALPGAWTLSWDEEFNYKGLPDPKKWVYEVGYLRNQEAQFYTNKRIENARVANGRLTITGLKDGYKGHAVTSASITTLGKFAFKYGLLEVRAKVPAGKGTWPAIWTMGTNGDDIGWPRCGEIDVMEYVGRTPGDVRGTCHWNSKITGKPADLGLDAAVPDVEKDFHVYSLDWTAEHVDFYVDKRLYHHFVTKPDEYTDKPFNAEHFLLLNLALGGWYGGPIDESIYPAKFEVDYVRYYQPK